MRRINSVIRWKILNNTKRFISPKYYKFQLLVFAVSHVPLSQSPYDPDYSRTLLENQIVLYPLVDYDALVQGCFPSPRGYKSSSTCMHDG